MEVADSSVLCRTQAGETVSNFHRTCYHHWKQLYSELLDQRPFDFNSPPPACSGWKIEKTQLEAEMEPRVGKKLPELSGLWEEKPRC